MAYLNKIDINGRTYYLQHLTDGKYEAILPAMTADSKIIIQDANVKSGNVGDTDTPVYIKDNRVTAFNKSIGDAVTPVYVRYGNIQPLSDDVGSTTNPIYMKAGAITASTETVGSSIMPIYMQNGVITPSDSTVGSSVKPTYLNNGAITESNATVGSGIVPIYMNAGTITESTETVGSNIKPIYMNSGEITVSDATVGSGIKPIYMQDGTITASNETVGTNIKPIYLNVGAITESNATIGSGVIPTYLNNGEITASTATIGSNVKPIYLNAGALTVSNGNVGSEIIPVYMAGGEITQTTKTVGSGVKPIYMNGGTITAFASTVGAINQPIYMNNGEITVCSDNVGSAGVPVYMENGAITACDTIPISSGGTGATTAEKALENFGLTATATELNTLDGITATVTELNYVDGVTSNIQSQFDSQSKALADEIKNRENAVKAEEERAKGIEEDHKLRIETMEAFFKEADIDASKEFIDTLKEIQTYIANDETGAKNMALSIKGNKDAIDVLNGSSSTEGSVAKAVDDAKTALESEINKKVDKIDGKGLSANDYSDAEKEKLEGIETGANKYIHPSYNVCTSGWYKITVDEFGHVSSVVAVTKEDVVGLGIPAQDTTYEVAVATTDTEDGVDGLLSAADKAKYDKYEATISGLVKQIEELQKLVESYHPIVEPEPEPDETE